MMRTVAMFAIAAAMAGCGSGGQAPAAAAAGPKDISALSPQDQLKAVENDSSIPPQFKQTAINSIKQKYGLR